MCTGHDDTAGREEVARLSRRGFLQLSAGVAIGTAAVAALGRLVGGNRAAVAEARAARDPPKPPTRDPPPGVHAAGATPWATAPPIPSTALARTAT